MHIPRLFLMPNDICLSGKPLCLPTLDLEAGQSYELVNQQVVNQIGNVLRLKSGNRINLLNGQGELFECTITATPQKTVPFKVDQRLSLPLDKVKIEVALAVLKGERFDWALQKLTELGVTLISPVLTKHTVARPDTSDAKLTEAKLSRWRSILKEAAEQCEGATIPHIVAPRQLSDWLKEFSDSNAGGANGTNPTNSIALICAERIASERPKDILLEPAVAEKFLSGTADATIKIVVGPEGGFAKEELRLAQEAGVKPVSLGPRILRSETAAIYALAQVIWCLEK